MSFPSSFVPIDENKEEEKSQFPSSFTPVEAKKEKVGPGKSILYGLAEGALAIPALAQYLANELSRPLEEAYYGEKSNIPFEKENPLLNVISKFPESEGQTARRLRVGASALPLSALAGIPGIIGGLVGSQAGQTIRELYGKEGKFEKFGRGEIGAITTDILTGGMASIIASLERAALQGAKSTASRIPMIFQEGTTALERANIKNVVQGERNALQNIVDSFATSQLQNFEREASLISPDRYTDLVATNVSGLQRHAENLYRTNNLSIISPLEVTPEQGGRAIQEAANEVFQQTVIDAERQAYGAARESAKDLKGAAPKTLEEAIQLRDQLLSTTPTGEQNPVINFLNGLIDDLQTTTPGRTIPASNILGPDGRPMIPAEVVPSSTKPTERAANDLVDMVQKGNQAINYGSELREQSHRLKPLLNTFRNEVREVLSKNPEAANLFHQANMLHANNAETWGTKYMRNVRFTENPESLIAPTQKASNMRNLKQAIPDPAIQALAERVVIDKMTTGGSSSTNRVALNNLAPELSANARNAGENLINIKDPLTTLGGRAQVRNEILKDAAQAVNSGKRPSKILDLMQTPKGYLLVRESLSGSPQGRQMFQAFERLFLEDIFSSITDSSGRIDFSKATNIFKNREIRQVTNMIGGPNLVNGFERLQTFANNLEKNIQLYSNPQTQSLFKSLAKNVKDAGFLGAVLHALHVPWPVIVSLGLGKATIGLGKLGYNAIQRKIFSSPQAMQILEAISKANTTEELAKQVPRLLTEINKNIEKK